MAQPKLARRSRPRGASARRGLGRDTRAPIAAIDIGSDTIHLTVAALESSGHLRHILDCSRLLRLGLVEQRDAGLPDYAVSSIRRTLKKFVRQAREARAETILIAATAAVREDPHHRAICALLATDVGVPVHIIPKSREIELGFLAARQYVRPSGKHIFVDSGGASTEITLCHGRVALRTVSMPVGASNLSILLEGDPPELLSFGRLMVPVRDALKKAPPVPAVGTVGFGALFSGGTAHHFHTLSLSPRHLLTRSALEAALRHLLRKRARKIAKKFGIEPARIPLLIAGCVILASILDFYGLDRAATAPSSIREGMIRADLASPGSWWK